MPGTSQYVRGNFLEKIFVDPDGNARVGKRFRSERCSTLNEAQLLTVPSMSSLGIVERRGELIRHNTRGLTLALTLRLSQT